MADSHVPRRDFLKVAAGQAGAAAISAGAYSKVLGANDRVRVGFIGIGLIGKRHLLDFLAQPDVEVAGISELYEPRMEEGVAACEGRPERFKDFRAMLDRKDIDAVVVSTPDHWHALMTIMACAAGKDVYVEKPLTHVQREGRWMIDAAKAHQRVVQVGTQQRSGLHYQKCVELIRSGHIGEVRSVRLASFRNIMPGFTTPVGDQPLSEADWSMWLGPAPMVPFDQNRCLYHFRWFWDYSGGQTTNLLSHGIDIVQWALDASPQTVAAMGARYSLHGIGETPDVFEAIFQYPGALATWSCREMCAGRPAGTGGTGGPSGSERRNLVFYGTRGALAIDRRGFEVIPDPALPADDQIPRFTAPRRTIPASELRPRTEALKEEGFQEVKDLFQPHVRNFVECIKSRNSTVSNLESGHKTATACHLANISMKVGRSLRWDAAREEILGDPEASRLLTKEYRAPWDKELGKYRT
ncbi:MAG TPA: Gfo/Idh/MocA family oxidoreductase [Isosphaeraceae bacterium]|jgi:predicted dehydrogenase|nr:Gfo/Idh/MocA family oxidoreductase [Isosphaeraceae bacterium]